jgi:hypothetical protein
MGLGECEMNESPCSGPLRSSKLQRFRPSARQSAPFHCLPSQETLPTHTHSATHQFPLLHDRLTTAPRALHDTSKRPAQYQPISSAPAFHQLHGKERVQRGYATRVQWEVWKSNAANVSPITLLHTALAGLTTRVQGRRAERRPNQREAGECWD